MNFQIKIKNKKKSKTKKNSQKQPASQPATEAITIQQNKQETRVNFFPSRYHCRPGYFFFVARACIDTDGIFFCSLSLYTHKKNKQKKNIREMGKVNENCRFCCCCCRMNDWLVGWKKQQQQQKNQESTSIEKKTTRKKESGWF